MAVDGEELDVFGLPYGPGEREPATRPGPEAVSAGVRALRAAVLAQLETEPWRQAGVQALADAQALLVLSEQVRVAALSQVAEVERRNLHLDDGAPTIGTWVERQQTSLDRGDLALSRRLASLPVLDTALRSGSLCVVVAEQVALSLARLRRHVDRPDGLVDGQPGEQVVTAVIVNGVRLVLCQALGGLAEDDPRLAGLVEELDRIAHPATLPTELARLEAAFVLLALQIEPAQLPDALGMLVDALLPVQHAERAEQGEHHRGLTLKRKADGSGWSITRGDLDLETGELLDLVLTSQQVVDEQGPADTDAYDQLRLDGWQAGDDLPATGGPRSRVQQRHDALRSALRLLLDTGVLGTRDKVAPHLAVTVGLDALHDAPGALPPVAASGLRLPRALVREWWCDSKLTRFVLGLGGRVLGVSHTERTLKAHERRAKHVETGGRCQGAGCCRGGPLVPHHVVAYARCGTTSLADTVLLCRQTHRDVHSGKVVRLKDGRELDENGWRPVPQQG